MKQPKIKWPIRKSKVQKILDETEKTKNQIEKLIYNSVKEAEKMSKVGNGRIQNILSRKRKKWVSKWNGDPFLVKWFGKVKKARFVKVVGRRMEKIYIKTSSKVLTIKVIPRPKSSSTTNAKNCGGFLSPNRFQVTSNWINKNTCERGSIIVHELTHEWFKDQKIDGKTVYSEILAKKLAIEKPRRARKSAENYERYCKELYCR